MRVAWPEGTVEAGQGSLSRVRCDEARGWWQRLEIIEDPRAETLRFISTTDRARAEETLATAATAFVVGNPDLSGWDKFCDLPGARQEAQKVTSLLNAGGYQARECIDEKADAILSGLHRNAWRILHLAGHGEHEFPLEETPLPKRVSGMVIGKNTFLTPGDVEQMRWVPELVFINCCHLGKTQSKTAAQGELNLLAANLAVQFIEMGVKAVVAAGWAVDDGAAEAFAAGFYTHPLAGEPFGQAVRAAREENWVRFPDVNTWGAYQCYGDPGYRLRRDGNEDRPFEVKSYHAPVELVSDLNNYGEWIRMRVHGKEGESDALLEELRAGIVDKLRGIPGQARAEWLARGDLAAALGFAWGEAVAYAEAVDWLEKALSARKGDCPVRAVEQCANFRVSLSGEHWRALREAADPAGAERARQGLTEDIERAIRELDLINQRAPTPKRLGLLGAACKRLAWVDAEAAPRLEALVNMANYYRQAFDSSAWPEPCLFANWATARQLALRLDPTQSGAWQTTLEDDCRHMIELARGRNLDQPTFRDGVAEADCELVLLLARTGLVAEAANVAAARVAEHYRTAARRGASPREYASVLEHLDFVAALADAADAPLVNALAALRAAL
ncbi:MAG: CHAT domain-containing protein [Pseudomonadota bacterium]|nr:CHAT domain-containing protein [Pseudomonadota bacterium]